MRAQKDPDPGWWRQEDLRVIREGFLKEVTIEQNLKGYVGVIQAEHEEDLQLERTAYAEAQSNHERMTHLGNGRWLSVPEAQDGPREVMGDSQGPNNGAVTNLRHGPKQSPHRHPCQSGAREHGELSLTLMASMMGSYRSGKPGNRNTMQWTSSASCSRQLAPEFESSLSREATMGGM